MAKDSSNPGLSRLGKRLLIAALIVLAAWLTFFDSHSLLRRVKWHREYAALTEENEALRTRIDVLEQQLEEVESDEVTEQIAREQYGMRKEGEKVYRVEKADGQ